MTRRDGLFNTYYTRCHSIGSYDMVQEDVSSRASFIIGGYLTCCCWIRAINVNVCLLTISNILKLLEILKSECNFSLEWLHSSKIFPTFFPAIFFEKIFMRPDGKDAPPGNLSLLLLIVKVVALVLFSVQDIAMWLDRTRLTGKVPL